MNPLTATIVRASPCVLVWFCVSPAVADRMAIPALIDNTLIESVDGDVSDGAGDSIRTGRTGDPGGNVRLRAVIQFDVGLVIPPGSMITSAALELRLIQSSSGPLPVSLHRIQNSWGEGRSAASGGQGAPATLGDATWKHRFFPSDSWLNTGGDFDPLAIDTQLVGSIPETVIWNSSALTNIIQDWVDQCLDNHGFILIGEESFGYTAKRFASRHYPVPAYHPRLIVNYIGAICTGDISPVDGQVNVDDLLAVVNDWGKCLEACPADLEPPCSDGLVNVDDLLAVIDHWGPCP